MAREETKRKRDRRSPQESSKSEGHGAKSEAVREAAILALLSEKSLDDAARRVGLSERTLRRWLSDDKAFKAEYDAARQATFEAGIGRIQSLVGKAVNKLETLLESSAPSVQLGAARTITELGVHRQDAEIIMRQLQEMEARQMRGKG